MSDAVKSKIILKTRSIRKVFSGVIALDGVSFEIHSGKVNALVGENGAGKSTLMKVLSGVYQDYDGEIFLDGQPVSFNTPAEAQDKGIAIIHQELNLIPNLSIAENVFLGREFLTPLGFIDYKKMQDETAKLLKKLDLALEPRTLVSELRVGQQQLVEIAKALSLNARIVIMDEPTSAISEHEIEVLFSLIRSLRNRGVAIVYITHKLDELFNIADRVTVLRDGKLISCRPISEVTHDDIVRMMVGRDIDDFFVKSETAKGDEVLRVENICLDHPNRPGDYLVEQINFSVKKGEVLGIYGLMGAGRSELFETIFGQHPLHSAGKVFVENQEVRIQSPGDAIKAGIGFVSEDRKLEGLVLLMSVSANITLPSINKIRRFGLLNKRLERSLAENYVERLKIKTPSSHQIVENLSGGNQQKVVIAKWLATNPKVILLDEPTRGIDVNSKNEIYRLISELASAGLGVVVVSSELPEIMAISDRILVLSEGRATGEFTYSEASEEKIIQAAIPKSIIRR